MATYRVVWAIEIEADSPEAAAREALEIQRDTDSLALFFDVEGEDGHTTIVNLLSEEE